MFLRILSLLLILMMIGCTSNKASLAVNADKKWISHTLDNGLQYHLYPTEGEKVELRLIVNVGSLNEQPQERGFAHFIEHMAFKSTQHFPDGVLFDDVGDFGVVFGPDLNGVTDYSRTIYTLSLPNNDKLNDALAWFVDILDGIQFPPEQVDVERDVIFGEWRFDDKESKAWSMQLYEALLENTPYANKDPIGEEKSLSNANPQTLAAFYNKWYQTERAQLVVVGEFEPENIEKKITRYFSKIKKAQKHINATLEKNDIYTLKDPVYYPKTLQAKNGQSAALVMNVDLGQYSHPKTLNQQSDQWLEWVVVDAIESRLRNEFERKNIPIQSISNNFAYLPGLNSYELILEFNNENRKNILIELASGLASLREHGLSENEYSLLMERFESMGYFLFNTQAEEIAESAVYSLFFNTLPQDDAQLSQNYAHFLKTTNRKKINKALTQFLSNDNKSLTFIFNQDEKDNDIKALNAIFFTGLKQEGKMLNHKKIAFLLPKPNLMNVKEAKVDKRGDHLYEWELENGLHIQFYQMDDMTQTTHVRLRAKGGIAALTLKERAALDMLYQTYVNGKMNDINAFDFFKALKRAGIYIEPAVYSSSHDFSITSPSDKITEALNAFSYVIENVEPSNLAFEQEKVRIINALKKMTHSPHEQFQRSVKNMVYSENSYDRPITQEIYEDVTFEDVQNVYDKLFSDLGNFSLYVVSEQPLNKMKFLVSGYLSHLSLTREETLPNEAIFNQSGGELIQHQSPEYRTFIEKLHITEVGKRNVNALFIEEMTNRVLQKRYTNIMREEYGFDYDPQVYSWGRDGDDIYVTKVTALISPEKEAQLISIWPSIVSALSKSITKKEKKLAQSQFERDLLTIRSNGQYMVAALARYGTWGYDQQALLEPKHVLNNIDNQKLDELTQSIFNHSVSFKSVLRPQKNKIKSSSFQIDIGSQL